MGEKLKLRCHVAACDYLVVYSLDGELDISVPTDSEVSLSRADIYRLIDFLSDHLNRYPEE